MIELPKIELPKDKYIAGVDEAGRGPLAGSVVASAVILPLDYSIQGLKDSKKLSETKRALLADQIKDQAVAWSVAEASVEEIDEMNILQASLLAMKRAIESLSVNPDEVWVDGNKIPQVSYPTKAIVKGDALVVSISAASILAKVTRDAQMLELDKLYPEYGFKQHKGYPTLQHRNALQKLGVLDIHRRSYAPVKKILLA